ncbi:MAG: AraC family transcriptional regulator [Bacillota bacterium]|nr:AraC family transcriptional regulator [Bacillota bacterium]
MNHTADFISQIPDGVLQKTEMHTYDNITLFKPLSYLGGVKFDVTDYHIVIPSENTPEAFFNNKLIHAEERQILAVNPGDTVTCLKSAPAKPYYSFLIKPDLFHKISEEMNFSGSIRFEKFLNPFSADLYLTLRNLEQEYNRPDRLNLIMDSLEIQVAAILLREFKTNIKMYNMPLLQSVDSYIHLAMEYMQTYFSSNITLDDICNEIHVSQYHFIRMFRKKTGMTPHRYLLKVRIENAKELLTVKHYSVAETAVLCGFDNIPHFSATFKKSTGYSPVDYKKRLN